MARPKYQIFISSTFSDLSEERKALTWALLSARHIPAGMENFTPADDRGWKTILSVIDKSDYYLLLLAGQYGSKDLDGISWTEKEYNYAIEKKIPVLVFIREKENISAKYYDIDPEKVAKRDAFHLKVKATHLTGFWKNQDDLVSLVTRALDNHIKDDEDAGAGRPGWYRGNEIPSGQALNEFARLSQENADLKKQLSRQAEPDFHGLSYTELKELMQNETFHQRWEPGNPEANAWDFFVKHADSLARKSIWKESATGQDCIVFAKFNLINVPDSNEPYELTEVGFRLLAQIKKQQAGK
jgi:Domain of unknown function (DUF4062)